MFIYKKGTTTVDEIIGHLLMRLNTDYPDTYIPIRDFCRADSETVDEIMATRVLEKMIKYDVATSSPGTGCDEFDMVLRPNGKNITNTLQWTQFVTIQDEIMAEEAKQNKPQQTINNFGNMVNGDNNSNINQGLDLREGLFHQTENQYPKNADIVHKKPTKSIFEKVRDFTNHEVIGGLTVLIIGTLCTAYYSEIWAWIKSLFEKL